MLLLTIDSSTSAGSVAIVDEKKIIAKSILNLEQTQSQRLMPQIISLLDSCNYEIDQIDAVGVGVGPGSFTGIRIGLATASTLAQSLSVPIVGVSTLEAIAYNLNYSCGYVCAVIPSNRRYVFAALFSGDGHNLKREFEDTLISIDNLIDELKEIKESIYFLGDIKEYESDLKAKLNNVKLVDDDFSFPNPTIIAKLAEKKITEGKNKSVHEIKPNYLKRPQAEIDWSK